jgi:hypothetical protein
MDKIKLYSPRQITAGSILCGTLAGLYMIKKNFEALGKAKAAKKTTLWSVVFVLSLPFLIYLLDIFKADSHIMTPLGVGLGVGLGGLAKQLQMTQKQILESETYGFRSNWNVLKVSIVSLIVLVLIVFAVLMMLFMFDGQADPALTQP